MISPTGAEPVAVRTFGSHHDGTAVVTGDHWIDVPLDPRNAVRRSIAGGSRATIRLYAREVRAADLVDEEQPYLVFLQGGPGGRSPRPGADAPGWIGWALRRYRVILLDQRGTGRSTPADRRTLAGLGTAFAQAEYLSHFRADAIVADAEALREHLLGDVPWTALGQSFGGFCVWTYLGESPEGLAAAMVTGGVPPLGVHPDEVYRATHRALARRTADLDEAHPEVRTRLAAVAHHVEQVEEYLPNGERLTVPRLQEIGHVLGTAGGPDALAHLADDAWAIEGERLSDTFLAGVGDLVGFARHPLYAVLHEACYAEDGMVTDWSAQRVRQELDLPETPVEGPDGAERLPLTGEMIYPHTLQRDPALRELAAAGALLAQRAWHEQLYAPTRLAGNTVPVAARIYTQDMYVDPDLSRQTAARTGTGPGGRPVLLVEDDERHHDGLRRAGSDVLESLALALGDAVPRPRSEPAREHPTPGRAVPDPRSDAPASDTVDGEVAS